MRATRAYIASAGTAAVMLGAAVAMFLMLSGFVAFGSWPGSKSGTSVNALVLKDAAARSTAVKVRVRADAVARARAAERRREQRAAVAERRTGAAAPAGTPVARTPGSTGPVTAPTGSAPIGGTLATPQQQTQSLTQNVTSTTGDPTHQVQQQVQSVQNQVNQVVDQVGSASPPDTSGAVNTVTNSAGSLLGR